MKPEEDDSSVRSSSPNMNNSLIQNDLNGDADDLSDDGDSDNNLDDTDLLAVACQDEITAQLAAAGPIGVAAAAAIATAKKRKRPHSFETNPSIRKRQQTRLIRKLRATIDEYTIRVGQQAVVLIVTPGKTQNNFKVFGARPLEDVLRNCRNLLTQELESALMLQTPPALKEDPSLHELPPLVVDGIPTPVEKMTQAQLRAFIPLMLKYSTGRGKPGWGKESTRPVWWPKDLPWANVRSDARQDDEKQKVSWTHALRQIVINCYKYHGREDLIPVFNEEEEKKNMIEASTSGHVTKEKTVYSQTLAHYQPTMVQAINNADGTVSIIQMDPNNQLGQAQLITLPDGTTAQIRQVSAVRIQQNGNDGVQTLQGLADVATGQEGDSRIAQLGTVDLGNGDGTQTVTTLAEAQVTSDGQLILTNEDGTQSTFPVSGMVTIPVSMYQTVVTNMGDGVPVMQAVCSSADTGTTGTTVIQVESGQIQTQGTNSEQQQTNNTPKEGERKRLKRS